MAVRKYLRGLLKFRIVCGHPECGPLPTSGRMGPELVFGIEVGSMEFPGKGSEGSRDPQ